MKQYLISDNLDTLTGLRMCGVEGVVVHTPQDTKQELERVMQDSAIGVVMLTEKLYAPLAQEIHDIMLNRPLPLIVQIPGRHGTERGENFLTAYVQEAIGVKL